MDTETPVDAWYVWLGVAAVSVALTGMAVSLPSTAAPDAPAAANTIEETATSPHDTTGQYHHDATDVRIGERRLWLRTDDGESTARIAFGRMVPAGENNQLQAVLDGEDPLSVYDRSAERDAWAAFHADVETARGRTDDPDWRPAKGTLRVRAIEYPAVDSRGETRATLVAA